jgi:hypothetical protein
MVVDVVVVEVSGVVVVVVVLVVDVDVVDVVVEVTTVTAVLSMGHDEVAAVGRICKGLIFSGTDVDVDGDEMLGAVTTVVVVDCATVTSGIAVIASVSDSAGATAGGSL